MKNTFQDQALGLPINSAAYTARRSPLRYLPGPDGQYAQAYFKQCKADSMLKMMNKLGKKADNFANGVREHGNYFSPGIIQSSNFMRVFTLS